MIELKIPGEAVRVVEVFRCRIKKKTRSVDGGDAVRSEGCYEQALVLFERADVEWNLVVEEPDTATNDRAIGVSWRNREPEPRREVVVMADTVAIEAKPEIEHDTRVHDPLVLHKR